jgi:hypothetical protein
MGRKERLITDSWSRERKTVFNSTHSREANGRNTNGKSEEEKTAAELQDNADDRYNRKGRIDGSKDLSGCRADSQGNPSEWEENQMTRSRWYSPQLSREIVSQLYYKAKAEGIPMTTLLNRIVGEALDADNAIEMRTGDEGTNGHDPK